MSNKSFAIRRVSWRWDAKNLLLMPSIEVSEITQGRPGVTIVIPVIPPEEGEDGGSTHQPPARIPPTPITITPAITQISVYHNGVLVGVASALNFIDG